MRFSHLTILIFLLVLSISCINPNNERYKLHENNAINDVIPEMIDYYNMSNLNNWHEKDMLLKIGDTLSNRTAMISKPIDYDEIKIEEYELELKLFDKLTNKKILPRKLNFDFQNENFEIVLVDPTSQENYKTSGNEIGYLFVSRVLFNRNFTKGYTSYIYFCGEACVWDNNIELVKKNNKWKISRYFSGGIS